MWNFMAPRGHHLRSYFIAESCFSSPVHVKPRFGYGSDPYQSGPLDSDVLGSFRSRLEVRT